MVQILSNKYMWVLLFLSVWMLFLDNYSYFGSQDFEQKKIEELEDNKKYHQEEIKKDQENIKLLKNPTQIEKYVSRKNIS